MPGKRTNMGSGNGSPSTMHGKQERRIAAAEKKSVRGVRPHTASAVPARSGASRRPQHDASSADITPRRSPSLPHPNRPRCDLQIRYHCWCQFFSMQPYWCEALFAYLDCMQLTVIDSEIFPGQLRMDLNAWNK